ncbi:hypothetical protein, partial [Pseudomonas lactis]|uniref:hypothetical protein n=1 Tax=Pseudomonas lactis TaxID=1615674 RepID=UPI003B968319
RNDQQLSYRQTAALFDIRKFDIIGLWERRFDEGGLPIVPTLCVGMHPVTLRVTTSGAGRGASGAAFPRRA